MYYEYEKYFKKRNALSWKNANKSLVDKDGAEGIVGRHLYISAAYDNLIYTISYRV